MLSDRMYTGVEDFPTGPEGHMLGCQNRMNPQTFPGNTTSGDNGKLASSASTQHV